ncbi:putative thaumatin-like protein-like [Capsicum annuum]|nr:putative thaumatin-like protein-like [Capsicum annuum]
MTQKVKPTPALVLFVLLSRTVVSVEFAYNGFNEVEVSNLSVNGGCSNSKNGVLQLTNETSRVVGHVFYKNPIKFKNDKFSNNVSFFSTGFAFAFGVVPEYAKLGGHGFAFTISRSKEMKGALLVDFEFGDISDIHVGIDINDLESNSSVNASYFSEGNFTKQNLFLQCGKTIQAWIDYDSNMTRIWTTVVGGPKKGKTYGLGVSQSSSYSSPMLPNSASISQNAEEIEVMRTKIEELPQYCAISDAKFVKFEALVKKHMPQVFEDGEDSESDD